MMGLTYVNNSSAKESEALAIAKLQQELIMEASMYENGNGNGNMIRHYYGMANKTPADSTAMKRAYGGQLLDPAAGGHKQPASFADCAARQSQLPLFLDSHNSEGEGERFQDICASMTANQFQGLNCRDGGGGAAAAFADAIALPTAYTAAACESLFRVPASNAVASVGDQPRAALPPSSVWRVCPTVDATNYAAGSHVNHPNSNHFGPPHQRLVRCGNNCASTPTAITKTTTTTSTTKQKCLFKRAFSDDIVQQQRQQRPVFSASTGLMRCVMPAREFMCCSIEAPLGHSWRGGPGGGGDSSIITEQLGAPPKWRLLCS